MSAKQQRQVMKSAPWPHDKLRAKAAGYPPPPEEAGRPQDIGSATLNAEHTRETGSEIRDRDWPCVRTRSADSRRVLTSEELGSWVVPRMEPGSVGHTA